VADIIEPALTPEEWAAREKFDGFCEGAKITKEGFRIVYDAGTAALDADQLRHGIAALALHGQPFGFTRKDVGLLVRCAESCERQIAAWNAEAQIRDMSTGSGVLAMVSSNRELEQRAQHFRSLAARIAALLPPDTP
jgi:hypothetical protein